MKAENILMVRRKGEIHIGKKATESLGVSGWKWLGVQIEGDCVFMRICKSSPMEIGDHLIRLRDKSSGLRGACLKFTEKIDFHDTDSLDLQFAVMPTDSDECVMLKIVTPGFAADKDTGCEEKAEANEDETDKSAQVKVARWIRANGCAEVSCSGDEGVGRFDGVACPLRGRSEGCGRAKLKEDVSAENWLISNDYSVDQETPLGTGSKPAEKQLDIFDLSGKPANSTRTRPLPEGLPEWLRGPLSRGEQVRVSIKGETNDGWAVGVTGSDNFPAIWHVLVASDGSIFGQARVHHIDKLSPMPVSLKPASECLAVAKALKIGLSPMQIEAIINGGVPPKGHDLPDEMFE